MQTTAPSFDRQKHARAVAFVLQEEFGIPMLLLEPETGEVIFSEVNWELSEHEQEALLDAARQGEPRMTPLSDGDYQIALPVFRGRKTILAAVGRLRGCRGKEQEAATQRRNLERWVRAVCERQRLRELYDGRRHKEKALVDQASTAWDSLLMADGVLRRLRVHKEPEKHQRLILDAAFQLLPLESLVWVPKLLDLPPMICGQPTLAVADCTRLLGMVTKQAAVTARDPLLCNSPDQTLWGQQFPQIRSILVLQAEDEGILGWLLALNRKEGEFRKTDALVLSPFLAILEMYGRSVGRFHDLKELLVGLTRSLTAAIDAKDPYTHGHSERVARVAVEIARQLAMPSAELGDVYLAGLLHDIGKIGILDQVLRKADSLTAEEAEHIKQHVHIGYSILSDLRAMRNLLPGVLYHHENYDGTGYPDQLKGEAIPLLARVIAVADAYDSMSSSRPYREALPCKEVEARLQKGAGTQWDQRVVEALLQTRSSVHAIRHCGLGESLREAMDKALRSGVAASAPSPGANGAEPAPPRPAVTSVGANQGPKE